MTDKTGENLKYPESMDYQDSEFSAAEKKALSNINQKVASGETLKNIVDFLFRETGSIMPCDRISIAFMEEDNRRLVLYYFVAAYELQYLESGYTADITGSSLEKLFKPGIPRIINDLEKYYLEHPQSESTRLLLEEGVRSNMTCPLFVDGRPAGVLFRSSRKPGAYSNHEIKLHLAIAERLGQAVEKAYRIEQLTSAINSYMEMLGFVTHELKSPLDSIITLGKTLTAGYFGKIDAKQKDIVDRIVKKAEYLGSLSKEYLNLSQFESGKIKINKKDADLIAQIMEPAIEIISPQIEAGNVSLERVFPPQLNFLCDPDLLKIVMVNLLGNAVKYGNINGRIRLAAAKTDGMLRVSIRNAGPGFPESQKKFLFKKFSRLQTEALLERKGTGIGLYMCWKIIQLHGGKIWADSRPGEWAEFVFEVPLELN